MLSRPSSGSSAFALNNPFAALAHVGVSGLANPLGPGRANANANPNANANANNPNAPGGGVGNNLNANAPSSNFSMWDAERDAARVAHAVRSGFDVAATMSAEEMTAVAGALVAAAARQRQFRQQQQVQQQQQRQPSPDVASANHHRVLWPGLVQSSPASSPRVGTSPHVSFDLPNALATPPWASSHQPPHPTPFEILVQLRTQAQGFLQQQLPLQPQQPQQPQPTTRAPPKRRLTDETTTSFSSVASVFGGEANNSDYDNDDDDDEEYVTGAPRQHSQSKRMRTVVSATASGECRTGRWEPDEHERFIQGIKLHGTSWTLVTDVVGTRTAEQVRSHASKFFKSKRGRGLKPTVIVTGLPGMAFPGVPSPVPPSLASTSSPSNTVTSSNSPAPSS